MRRQFASLLLFLIVSNVQSAPEDAVVRLPSHGASATVIYTEPGRTFLLGCGHAFEGNARFKPITIDVPVTARDGHDKRASIKLVALDMVHDLSLVEMSVGPLSNVAPVAPTNHRSGRTTSVGYDEMRMPAQRIPTTILGVQGDTTFTRERPWHGRSGGGLIDDSGYLVGVVQGYEIRPGGRGLYVSHQAILQFLAHPPPVTNRPQPPQCSPFQ